MKLKCEKIHLSVLLVFRKKMKMKTFMTGQMGTTGHFLKYSPMKTFIMLVKLNISKAGDTKREFHIMERTPDCVRTSGACLYYLPFITFFELFGQNQWSSEFT